LKETMERKKEEREDSLEYFSRSLRFSFVFLKGLVAVLVLYYLLFSGFFTVRQDEVAVVLRWGSIRGVGAERILHPGFHWALPEPVDRVVRIPVKKVQSLQISEFWSPDLEKEGAVPQEFLTPYLHGYCITGDSNLIHTRWQVEYLISDPLNFIIRVKDEKALLKDTVCNAVIETVGSFSVDEALRTNLEEISRLVRMGAQNKLDKLESGISLTGIYLNRSVPPLQTEQAFNKVIKAEQEKSTQINEARRYATHAINNARGEASQILSEANTYKNEVVNESLADAEYIQKLTKRFPQGSKQMNTYLAYFYQESIEKVLREMGEKFIMQKPIPGKENELRIILGKQKQWEGVK